MRSPGLKIFWRKCEVSIQRTHLINYLTLTTRLTKNIQSESLKLSNNKTFGISRVITRQNSDYRLVLSCTVENCLDTLTNKLQHDFCTLFYNTICNRYENETWQDIIWNGRPRIGLLQCTHYT